MTAKDVVVGFSFGTRGDHPSISDDVMMTTFRERFPRLYQQPLILQKELALCIPSDEFKYREDIVIIQKHERPNNHLDLDDVATQAARAVLLLPCEKIYIMAYPFLHRSRCVDLVKTFIGPKTYIEIRLGKRKKEIEIEPLRLGWIPCDPESDLWWTRNPFYLALYALRKALSR